MKKLLIYNNYKCHYEVIESIIVKYKQILNLEDDILVEIYLHIRPNSSFKQYIINKYPNIIFNNIINYDYYVNCTIYDLHFNKLDKNLDTNKKYISHEITERLKANPNVYFLTPLAKQNIFSADILPFSQMRRSSNVPIYIIQGNINDDRRYTPLLVRILENNYNYKFYIKLVGRYKMPAILDKYKDKLILRNNLNFIDFHKEFLDAYCIIPLITKETHFKYYKSKLTSSINYAIGYNLKCLIDRDLQDIYKLKNVEVYNNINDISLGFKRTLENFYQGRLSKNVKEY